MADIFADEVPSDSLGDGEKVYADGKPSDLKVLDEQAKPTMINANPWLVAVCVVLMLWSARGCLVDAVPDIDPGPKPTPIVVEHASVLFAITDDMSPEQGQVAISQKVQGWCDDNGVDYRRYHVDADLSREDDSWQKMMAAAKDGSPPSMVAVDASGNGRVKDIPETVDAAIEAIKAIK